MFIEDLNGSRIAKAEERKRNQAKKRKLDTGSSETIEGDLQEGFGAFPLPTQRYTCELLATSVKTASSRETGEKFGKMVFAKLSLLSIMIARTPMKDPSWTDVFRTDGQRWKERVEESMEFPEGICEDVAKRIEGMRRMIVALVAMF